MRLLSGKINLTSFLVYVKHLWLELPMSQCCFVIATDLAGTGAVCGFMKLDVILVISLL